MEFLELGGEKWSFPFFKERSLHECRRILAHKNQNQVINVWKQINGKTVPKRKKEKKES